MLQVGIFGPLKTHPSPTEAKLEDDDEMNQDEHEETRKRLPPNAINGSPAKRPRLSNGFDGALPVSAEALPMEIDQQDDHHAYPSPGGEADQAATPSLRTEGPDQGTQVDKVEELLPQTTFVKLFDDQAAATVPEATAPSSPLPAPVGETAPILLQCEWNPRDPSMLAAAGTDALARIWTVSRVTGSDPPQDHVSPAGESLVDATELPKSVTVTALTWSSDGEKIALATDYGPGSRVKVCSRELETIREFEALESPVIKLAWNPSNTVLLTLAPLSSSPDVNGAQIAVHEVESGDVLTYKLEGHDMAQSPLDATWTSDSDLLVCGGDVLLSLHCGGTSLAPSRKFETRTEDSFRQVLFDWRSKLAATSSDKGNLDVSECVAAWMAQ